MKRKEMIAPSAAEILPEEPAVEEREEIEEVSEEATVPSVEVLDKLLQESDKVATVASMSEKEIDEAVRQRQEALNEFKELERIREARLGRVENYNPLKELTPQDYERLVSEEIIDPSYAERLKKLDEVIEKLESLDYPTPEASAELEKLTAVGDSFREKIESQVEEKQEELANRREEVKNKIAGHYDARIHELGNLITEVEENPRVIERLHTTAEAERMVFEKKVEAEKSKINEEASRYLQSLGDRQASALERIDDLLQFAGPGKERLVGDLAEAIEFKKDYQAQKQTALEIRRALMDAVVYGEGGQQLKEPREVAPWKVYPTTIRYYDAINFLKSTTTEQALTYELLERRERILLDNEVLRRVIGPQWIEDKQTREKQQGSFWAAFETRKKMDEFAEANEENKGIVERGGFVVDVPIFKEIKGRGMTYRKELVGRECGIVRLEETATESGNKIWKVLEVAGVTPGLEVGSRAGGALGDFPEWFRRELIRKGMAPREAVEKDREDRTKRIGKGRSRHAAEEPFLPSRQPGAKGRPGGKKRVGKKERGRR